MKSTIRAIGAFIGWAALASFGRSLIELWSSGGHLEGWAGSVGEQAFGLTLLTLPYHLVFGGPIAIGLLVVTRILRLTRQRLVILSASVGAALETLILLLPGNPTAGTFLIDLLVSEILWVGFFVFLRPPRPPSVTTT